MFNVCGLQGEWKADLLEQNSNWGLKRGEEESVGLM